MTPHGNDSNSSTSCTTMATAAVTIKDRVRISYTSTSAFGGEESSVVPRLSFLELEEPSQGHHALHANPIQSSYTQDNTSSHQPKSIMKRTSHGTTSTPPRKSVQFNALQIRTFPQILGDHPCCSSGLPLSLDWTHTSERIVSIEKHESERIPREKMEMHLNDFARREILQCVTAAGGSNTKSMYSEAELMRAERRMFRERERTKKRIIVNQFFQTTAE